MSVGIVYPDIVSIDVAYLQAVLDADPAAFADSVDVRTREPNPWPANNRVVTVRRSGGADSIVVDRARVDFQVWHDSEGEAIDLANLIRAYLLAMPGVHSGVTVYRVTTFSGPSLIWDADRNLPRFLLTFEQDARGTAL